MIKRRQLIALVILLSMTRAAAAEGEKTAPSGVLSMRHPTILETPTARLTLPPGMFFPDDKFKILDTEFRRLQDAETRLTAENASLKNSATGWQPGWRSILSVAISAFVGGFLVHRYLGSK